MAYDAINDEINKDLDKPAHKLLIKVLLIVTAGLGVVMYFGWKMLSKAYDDRFNTVTAERDQWKTLYFEERKYSIDCTRLRIEENKDAKVEYDTIQQLIKRKR